MGAFSLRVHRTPGSILEAHPLPPQAFERPLRFDLSSCKDLSPRGLSADAAGEGLREAEHFVLTEGQVPFQTFHRLTDLSRPFQFVSRVRLSGVPPPGWEKENSRTRSFAFRDMLIKSGLVLIIEQRARKSMLCVLLGLFGNLDPRFFPRRPGILDQIELSLREVLFGFMDLARFQGVSIRWTCIADIPSRSRSSLIIRKQRGAFCGDT